MTSGTGSHTPHSSAIPKLEYWREMRAMIMHEDNLVNHRFSWLLTYEGFLMGGFFLVQNGLFSNKVSTSVVVSAEGFLLLVMAASMWICFITGQTISAAYRQTAMAYHMWIKAYPHEKWQRSPVPRWFSPFTRDGHDEPLHPPANSEFPPLLGKFSYHGLGRTVRIPFILCLINCLAAAACIAVAVVVLVWPGSLYTPADAPQKPVAARSAQSPAK